MKTRKSASVRFVVFWILNISHQKQAELARPLYDASCNINDENLLGILDKLGWIERCIFAELYNGDILMHNYYMTGKNNTVNPNILINQKDTIPITISLPIGQAPRVIDGKFKLSISVGPLQ